MNKYIFLIDEGYTYQPESCSIEPDCENDQLIGIAEGENQKEAFDNLLKLNEYLNESNFQTLYCYQLKKDYEKTYTKFDINYIN